MIPIRVVTKLKAHEERPTRDAFDTLERSLETEPLGAVMHFSSDLAFKDLAEEAFQRLKSSLPGEFRQSAVVTGLLLFANIFCPVK